MKMDKLLAAVQKAIGIDPSNYEIFLEILGTEKKYSTLVKEMRGMVIFTFHHRALLLLYILQQVQPLPIYVPGYQSNSFVQDGMCIYVYLSLWSNLVHHKVLFAHFFSGHYCLC